MKESNLNPPETDFFNLELDWQPKFILKEITNIKNIIKFSHVINMIVLVNFILQPSNFHYALFSLPITYFTNHRLSPFSLVLGIVFFMDKKLCDYVLPQTNISMSLFLIQIFYLFLMSDP